MGSIFYFFWISLTVSLVLVWSLHRARMRDFPPKLILNLTGGLLLVVPVAARLLHVIYEEPQYYKEDPIRILEFWKGGFVYYGGLVGGLLFALTYFLISRREKGFWPTADLMTLPLCFGTGLGRIACFIEGCCHGREFEGLWSVNHLHPTQLYLFTWEMGLLIFLGALEKRKFSSKVQAFFETPGTLFLFWISSSALGRFLVENYRGDHRGEPIAGLSISQWVALVLLFSSLMGSLFLIRKGTPRKLARH